MVNTKQVRIKEEELKKLKKYKVHEYEPYWQVIKRILEEKENVESQ